MNIAELMIDNVLHLESKLRPNRFVIRFEIDGFRYNLLTRENEYGIVYPKSIYHFDDGDNCTYCKQLMNSCEELAKYKQELFQRLIEFPSIRLEWLYIDHV